MNKLAKFFIICGGICVLGIGLAVAGFATGGLQDIDKVSEKYDWMRDFPPGFRSEQRSALEFTSIDIEGNADVIIAGPSQWQEAKEIVGQKDGTIVESAGAGDVFIRWNEAMPRPNLKVHEGVLYVKTGKYIDAAPDVVIFCSDSKLKSIKETNLAGDMFIYGVNVDSCEIVSDSGDLDFQAVTCGKLNVQSKDSDIEINGIFSGETTVSTIGGDIDFNTSISRDFYTIEAYTDEGKIRDDMNNSLGSSYKRAGGENILKLRTNDGDISLWFRDSII